MIKESIKYLLYIGLLFIISYFSHNFLLGEQVKTLPFVLLDIYIFHALFTLLVCIVFNILSFNPKMLAQLGFIYLGVLMFKIVVFCMVFYEPLFTAQLSKTHSIYLLIPTVIFLLTEVYFLVKILNKKIS